MPSANASVSESILNSIKKIIGISADYTEFDVDIIFAINTAFFTLWQLGVGSDPSEPFKIEDAEDTWDDFIEPGEIEMCKSYIALRVRMLFDPPSNSFLADAINGQIKEYEVRMTYAVDELNDYYAE